MGSVQLSRAQSSEVRDEVIDLLWEHRHWPGESREEYGRLWDWRYSSLGEGEPLTWIARSTDGELVAHLAVFPRRFRIGQEEIRCALPGDVLVHRAWRTSGIGARMILLPRSLVAEGESDMVLVVGNALVHRLCTRMGFRDLGTYHVYADVRRSGPILARRARPVAVLAPTLDLLLAARRRWLQRRGRRSVRDLSVRPLDEHAVSVLDRAHWQYPPDRLVAAERAEYLARRFLTDPFARRQIFGLFDRDGRVEGHVTVELRAERAVVCDCRVNAARLTEATAIALVSDHLAAHVQAFAVSTSPESRLASEFRAAGFVHRPPDPTDTPLHLLAWWDQRHPAAESLARLQDWNLYTGAADG